jgi:hypothetical protein
MTPRTVPYCLRRENQPDKSPLSMTGKVDISNDPAQWLLLFKEDSFLIGTDCGKYDMELRQSGSDNSSLQQPPGLWEL